MAWHAHGARDEATSIARVSSRPTRPSFSWIHVRMVCASRPDVATERIDPTLRATIPSAWVSWIAVLRACDRKRIVLHTRLGMCLRHGFVHCVSFVREDACARGDVRLAWFVASRFDRLGSHPSCSSLSFPLSFHVPSRTRGNLPFLPPPLPSLQRSLSSVLDETWTAHFPILFPFAHPLGFSVGFEPGTSPRFEPTPSTHAASRRPDRPPRTASHADSTVREVRDRIGRSFPSPKLLFFFFSFFPVVGDGTRSATCKRRQACARAI